MHNVPAEVQHLAALCTFNPPAGYYKSPPVVEGSFICSDIEIDSSRASPKYVEEFKIVQGIDPTLTSQIVIDLYDVQTENGVFTRLVNIGWTILPLFHHAGGNVYVNTGAYMVLSCVAIPMFSCPCSSRRCRQSFSQIVPPLRTCSHICRR